MNEKVELEAGLSQLMTLKHSMQLATWIWENIDTLPTTGSATYAASNSGLQKGLDLLTDAIFLEHLGNRIDELRANKANLKPWAQEFWIQAVAKGTIGCPEMYRAKIGGKILSLPEHPWHEPFPPGFERRSIAALDISITSAGTLNTEVKKLLKSIADEVRRSKLPRTPNPDGIEKLKSRLY